MAPWDQADTTNYYFEPGNKNKSLEKTIMLIPLDGEEEEKIKKCLGTG